MDDYPMTMIGLVDWLRRERLFFVFFLLFFFAFWRFLYTLYVLWSDAYNMFSHFAYHKKENNNNGQIKMMMID